MNEPIIINDTAKGIMTCICLMMMVVIPAVTSFLIVIKWQRWSDARFELRKRCAPIISETIERVGVDDKQLLKTELEAAFVRAHYGYYRYPNEILMERAWRQEVKIQIRWYTVHRAKRKG